MSDEQRQVDEAFEAIVADLSGRPGATSRPWLAAVVLTGGAVLLFVGLLTHVVVGVVGYGLMVLAAVLGRDVVSGVARRAARGLRELATDRRDATPRR